MDDDDFRRGRPSLHKAFGEATAILAGDALLTLAFEILAAPLMTRVHRPDTLLAVISELARAAGARGLIAGQVADIMCEGKTVDARTVDHIVRNKTAALIKASLTCGARLAGGTREQIDILGRFGEDLGIAFQIRDDLLDLEGDAGRLGKAVGKDEQRGKATYPNLLGKEQARSLMQGLVGGAVKSVRVLGDKSEPLALIGEYVGKRVN